MIHFFFVFFLWNPLQFSVGAFQVSNPVNSIVPFVIEARKAKQSIITFAPNLINFNYGITATRIRIQSRRTRKQRTFAAVIHKVSSKEDLDLDETNLDDVVISDGSNFSLNKEFPAKTNRNNQIEIEKAAEGTMETNDLNRELLKFRRNRQNGAQLAHRRLDLALQSRDSDINEKSFHTVLVAYAGQSARGDWMAPLRSEQVLQSMKQHPSVRPTVFGYNACMEAWVKSATHKPKQQSQSYRNDHQRQQQPPKSPSSGKKKQNTRRISQNNNPRQRKQRSILQARNAVLRLWDDMKKDTKLSPNVYSYNLVLELWAKSPHPSDLHKAEEWFLHMPVEPDRQTFHLLFAAHANHGHAVKAERLLDGLLQDYQNNDEDDADPKGILENQVSSISSSASEIDNIDQIEPSQPLALSKVWFHCVLKALVQDVKQQSTTKDATDLRNAGERADQLLATMHQLSSSTPSLQLQCHPDATTYNHVINVHAQLGNTQRVEELLQELEHLYRDVDVDDSDLKSSLMPDCITYTTALKAYANANKNNNWNSRLSTEMETSIGSGSYEDETYDTSPGSSTHEESCLENIQRAERLFQRMADLAAAGRPKMNPSIITYNTMIQIWSKTGCKEDLYKAMDLLEHMKQSPQAQQSLPGFRRPPSPNALSYITILHGWSRIKHVREAGYKAEELLQKLEALPPNARRNVRFGTLYNSCMTAWSRSGDKNAPQRVEALLQLLEDKYYESDGAVAPDAVTYVVIADTYAKARVPDAEQRCDDLLLRMKQLEDSGVTSSIDNSGSNQRAIFNSILNALAKSGQSSSKDKAEEILTMMQTSPNQSLQPDIVTYATIIDCHTKSGSSNTAERAEELLRFVEGSYRNGNDLLKPNAVFYSAILQAWAKTATLEGAEKAEWLLRRNEGLYQRGSGYEYAKPHAIMYNAVMDSIARSGMREAGERAEELLREMMSLYDSGEKAMKPSRRSFNAVMLAYRHDGKGAEKAVKLLDRMEELADTWGDSVRPNAVSYNCAIQAIVEDSSSSNNPDACRIAAQRAQALLDRMEEKSIQPDATTYSCVIESWLKCHDEKGSVMAELMLQKFLELVESNRNEDWEARLNADVVWDVINAYKERN